MVLGVYFFLRDSARISSRWRADNGFGCGRRGLRSPRVPDCRIAMSVTIAGVVETRLSEAHDARSRSRYQRAIEMKSRAESA